MRLTLFRVTQSADGTFGVLCNGSVPIATTCEDPWSDNATGASCIPAGIYNCIPHNSPKYANVWEVSEVPGRLAILIHNGNTIDDTQGCILVGNGFGMLNGKISILDSRMTLQRLQGALPKTFDIEIIDAF